MPHDDHLTRDFVGYGPTPPNARWPKDARVALNLCLNVEEGGEKSVPDGDDRSEGGLTESRAAENAGRDLAAESMFEYGSRVGFWRLMDLVASREMTATIFGTARALERNPLICEAIRANSFDVCAHGWKWESQIGMSEADERARIKHAVLSIERSTGTAPLGWYCRYGPSINTRRLLVEHGGFLYDSDAYNDEIPYWVKVGDRPHLVVPYGLICNDANFLRGNISTGDDFANFLKDTFDTLYAEGAKTPKMMSVGLHLRIAGHPGRSVGAARFLDHVLAHENVWICNRTDIAKHWIAHHPYAS
jgi:allantoinase